MKWIGKHFIDILHKGKCKYFKITCLISLPVHMGFAEWHILDILFVVMGLELLTLELWVHFPGEQPQQELFLWLLKVRTKNTH